MDWHGTQEIKELKAELDKLRTALDWIIDHSNDPGVVRKALKALGK
jgi:hypothetical protein